MHDVAYWAMLLTLFISIFAAFGACFQANRGGGALAVWFERAQFAAALLLTFCSSILFVALVNKDYSFKYVYEYTDNVLPLFYSITAFWAGQDGSLLFWAWLVALMALIFPTTRGYEGLGERTKSFYWAFFFAVQALFLLLLTNWSNPFVEVVSPPSDGRGLNPLLQNPGMIFHPPLLFIGYGGFTIPACLALAARISGDRKPWLDIGRNWVLFSWVFLTAGIILGAWWSYMELGWGGYWAWDPVENASLIPWLTGTAFLHTAIVEERRGALASVNIFLVNLTLMLCFFGTYLVRSGVIDSLHAFGGGGVATPLLLFILSGMAVTGLVIVLGDGWKEKPIGGLLSRQGLLFVTAWVFVALGVVVFLGTMWPLISKLWSDSPVGFDAHFYNRVCLPLFTLLSVALVFCPWLGWKEGLRKKKAALAVFASLPVAAAVLFMLGIRQPVALVAASSALAVAAGMIVLPFADPSVRRRRPSWGFVLVHLGLALMVLGVAVSGPYQVEKEAVLKPGQSMDLKGYTLTYHKVETRQNEAMIIGEARITVEKDGRPVGEMLPQRRLYRNFDQPFAEVSVISGLGDELYSTLLGFDRDGTASIKASIHPLVNWIWIGGTLMSLAGFVCFRSGRKAGDE